MSPDQLVDVLLGVCGVLITAIMGWFLLEFRSMRHSIDRLNTTMIEVVGKLTHHDGRLERIETHLEL